MKRVFQFATLVAIISLSACSQCYECTYEVEIQSPGGQVTTSTESESVCTSDQSEIDAREADGQTCAVSS